MPQKPWFQFLLNGDVKTVSYAGGSSHRFEAEAVPTTTLLDWLRATGHTGTKEGCAEGDCGACSVLLLDENGRGEPTWRAINACIALLPMFADREIVTVEGLASTCQGRSGPLHPVQDAMVSNYGSQCGYCTPGFVCSMAEAYYRTDLDLEWQKGDQLAGNLCRCTGYRPIKDALDDALAERDARIRSGAHAGDLLQVRLSKGAPVRPRAPLQFDAGTAGRFERPTSLEELLERRASDPGFVLVAGATEIGVDLNKKGHAFPKLLSTEGIPELARIERRGATYRVYGAATLTALEEAIGKDVPALSKMLSVFASRQIRSRATLAGNLVTASPIGDMAPVLLALDATITLVSSGRGSRTLPLAEFFLGYRKTALLPDEIVYFVEFEAPVAGGPRRVDSYKVSKRRELDIAIVAAAFALERADDGTITHARLAYGGVAATPVRALATEGYLRGRHADPATLRGALSSLEQEFAPIGDVRSGAEFRRGLIPSLFEKFWRGETSASQDEFPESVRARSPSPARAPGQALAHESAVGHVTGAALYADDQAARRRGALTMWPVLSAHAHGKLVSVDVSLAERAPGVVCVLQAKDIPGLNDIGAIRKDETLLAEGEVKYHGHPIAIVVGESREACRKAAALVKVEVEALPSILGLRAAIAANSFHTAPHVIRRGDPEAAFRRATHVVSGEIEIGGQEHFYLESQAAWAEVGDEGDLFVVSSTQHPSEIQAVVSHVLHLPRNQIVVQSPRMGGGFGGKETQGNAWAALVALAAMKTKRPVRVQLDRDLDMAITGKRHPFLATYKVACDDEGHLLAFTADLVSDGGWALDLSESICDRALFHIDNAYFVPNMQVTGRVAMTHVTSHTAFRGFGGPQGMLVIEEAIDRVARLLGLPPEIVRGKNLYRGEGETATTHYGQRVEDNRIGRIWETLVETSELSRRRDEIARYNGESHRVKRGIAITPVKFGISFTASFLNQAGALVVAYRDGTLQVNHGGTEMGQGLSTKILGVAMRELGLPAAMIRVMKTQTDKVPNTSATAASSGADLNGAAVRNACLALKERLAPVAAELLSRARVMPLPAESVIFEDGFVVAPDHPETRIAFREVVEAAYLRQISLSANGYYRTPGLAYDRTKGYGRPFLYYAFGAAVTEVEVDGWSGMKRVLRVDILHDVGDSLHPSIDRGQVEGGFVQGMGWLTGEELLWDASGRLMTHSASTYQIPSIGDAPLDFRVALLPDAAQKGTIHGSKAVGEPPLMLALSVREALKDAIAAFEGKRDVRSSGEIARSGGGAAPGRSPVLASPATHEAIFAAVSSLLAERRADRPGGSSVAAE